MSRDLYSIKSQWLLIRVVFLANGVKPDILMYLIKIKPRWSFLCSFKQQSNSKHWTTKDTTFVIVFYRGWVRGNHQGESTRVGWSKVWWPQTVIHLYNVKNIRRTKKFKFSAHCSLSRNPGALSLNSGSTWSNSHVNVKAACCKSVVLKEGFGTPWKVSFQNHKLLILA